MAWYYYIAWLLIITQLVFMYHAVRNYMYALKKYEKDPHPRQSRTVLIVPCKGRDTNFEHNIASFYNLDYNNYLLWFVVEDASDPAYDALCRLKEKLRQNSKAADIQILVAGKITPQNNSLQNDNIKTYSCGQKTHNMLYCYHRIPQDVETMAFADSDICVSANWLSHLVFPLRKPRCGATTGYRWFVPQKNNLATITLACVNAKVAQLLGDSMFNLAWGGSMAIRVDMFRQIGLDRIWPNTISDDASLTIAVKKARKRIIFAPACLVASHEKTSWKELFEFGRRQFLITRICVPGAWWFALGSGLSSRLGLWGTAALAFYAAAVKNIHTPFFAAVPVLFFACQFGRAILRQTMANAILKNERQRMKTAMAADIAFFWAWSFLLLFFIISSAFGRTITWRGVRYKLLGPGQTVAIEN